MRQDAFDTFARIQQGFILTSLAARPALALAPGVGVPAGFALGANLLAWKYAMMQNRRVRDRELLTRFRGEHIGTSNYAPARMKENLRLRW